MAEKELIINVQTGEETYVELTPERLAALEEMQRVSQEQENERLAKIEAINAIKASAREKLVAGEPLTPEEAAVIVL